MKERRKRRTYSKQFKEMIVKLYNSGKTRKQLIKEYDLTASTLASWISMYNNTGSFETNDNRTEKEKEYLKLKRENRILKMENDILKQLALIVGQKSA